MTTLLLRLSNAYYRHLSRKAERIMHALYPDSYDRAMVHATMATEAMETHFFGEGDSLGSIEIVQNEDDTYDFTALSKSEIEQ